LSEPRYKKTNEEEAQSLGEGPWKKLLELAYPKSKLEPSEELQALVNTLQEVHTEPWSEYIGTQQVMPMLESLPPEALPSVKAMMESSLFVDPTSYLSRIHVPVLAIFGEKDASVPVKKSIGIYEQSLRTAGNMDLTVKVFPEANHTILVDNKPASGFYSTMVEWLIGLEELVFIHVNILPMDQERILEDYSLVVRDGKIVALGPASSIKYPGNAKVVDASGKFLIPALSDMHVHLEGDAWNIMYPPGEGYTSDELNYEDILFPYIANGITMVQVMSAFPEHIALRELIQNHEILGPRLVLSRMIDGAGKAWPPPISTWVNDPSEAGKAVREANELGYDRIKAYSFLDLASYDTLMLTAATLNMPVDGHIPLSSSLDHMISSGQKMIAHSEELTRFAGDYSSETINDLSTQVVEGGVWINATLITSRNLIRLFEEPQQQLSKPGTAYLHPMGADIEAYIYENLYKPIPESHRSHIKEVYESFQLPFVKTFHASGGKLLAGSDVLIPANLPGFTLHEELEELVKAGLTPYEALRVSTINAHDFLGELESSGTIEP
ncbi:MAG: amidohydrolase family protein, partial [bacterium]|nr:amidohydrolase family protein [bacterium]